MLGLKLKHEIHSISFSSTKLVVPLMSISLSTVQLHFQDQRMLNSVRHHTVAFYPASLPALFQEKSRFMPEGCLKVINVTRVQFSAGQIWIGAWTSYCMLRINPDLKGKKNAVLDIEQKFFIIPSLSFFSPLYLIAAYMLNVDVYVELNLRSAV